jgi:hypothetical protein
MLYKTKHAICVTQRYFFSAGKVVEIEIPYPEVLYTLWAKIVFSEEVYSLTMEIGRQNALLCFPEHGVELSGAAEQIFNRRCSRSERLAFNIANPELASLHRTWWPAIMAIS